MDALILRKLTGPTGNPSLNDEDIDLNWTQIEEKVAELIAALELGAVYIVSASSAGGALTFTMSNGATIGPIPFSGLPFRVLGAWVTEAAYELGDFIINADSWGIARHAFVGGDTYAADVAAGHIAALPLMGGTARPMIQRFEALGSVTNTGEKLVGQFVVPYNCAFLTASPILGAITTPISSGGASMDIKIRRVTPAGVSTSSASSRFTRRCRATSWH